MEVVALWLCGVAPVATFAPPDMSVNGGFLGQKSSFSMEGNFFPYGIRRCPSAKFKALSSSLINDLSWPDCDSFKWSATLRFSGQLEPYLKPGG